MILSIPIAYWSGFGIFKQNRENSDEIGMVGQSVNSKRILYSYNYLHFRLSLELQSPATEEPAAAQYSGTKRFLHDRRHQSCFSDHGQMRERSKNYEIRVSSIEVLIDSVVNRSFMEAILIQR